MSTKFDDFITSGISDAFYRYEPKLDKEYESLRRRFHELATENPA